MTTVINRKTYLNKVKPHIGKHLIKVFTGHRRCGKSYLMLSLMNQIKSDDKKANIIFINKEFYEFDDIRDYHDLQKFFNKKHKEGVQNYLFVDEIQEISQFEKCIRNIFSKNLADIYISGSNSDLLSSELATLLSGRYIEVHVHPLSYPEFLEFRKLKDTTENFSLYMKQGGMPGLTNMNHEDESVRDYLQGILSTVLLKDVVKRFNIRNVSFLDNLVRFQAENIGKLLSARSISDYLKSQKISVSHNLVIDYLKFISSSFLTSKVQRREITGKKIFEIGEKYYFEDCGIRNTLVAFSPLDISGVLENIVYNHLCIAGYSVFIGQKGAREIDFIAEKNNELLYVQVAWKLSGQKTTEREFGNLLGIDDNYKKVVVTLEGPITPNTFRGIEHKSIREFIAGL
ncbi:AAA domain protein [anaerobic digester metagenome]